MSGLLKKLGSLFSYKEQAPLSEEQRRRFELTGKSNKELNLILGQHPPLHCKKSKLVDMIIHNEYYSK